MSANKSRKLLICALQRNNVENGVEVLQAMGESARQDPKTLHLAFKLALRSGDREMASDCLRQISEVSSRDPQYIYSCCIDAQEAEDKICAIQALLHLIQKSEFNCPDVVHLPALLRIAIRLETSLLNDESQSDADYRLIIDDICRVFEGGEWLIYLTYCTKSGIVLTRRLSCDSNTERPKGCPRQQALHSHRIGLVLQELLQFRREEFACLAPETDCSYFSMLSFDYLSLPPRYSEARSRGPIVTWDVL